MRKSIKNKLFLILSICFLTQSLYANTQSNLKQNFLNKIDQVVFVVQDKLITKDERNTKIVDILTPMFDFKLMAKLSLGKKWKRLNKANQKRFIELYVKRMKQSYSSKLDAYSDEKVKVTKMKQPKSNRIALMTDLISKDNKLSIIYKYYKPKRQIKDKDDWLIYDVEILGVSILKTDKAQFREYLQTKSISQLMDHLAKK